MKTNFMELNNKIKKKLFLVIIVVIVLVAVHLVFLIRLHVMLIIGIKRRIPDRLRPFLFMTAIGTLIGFLAISSYDLLTISIAIISGAIHIYFFICLYSLQARFKKEQIYKF